MHRTSPPLVLHVFPTFAVGGAQVRFAALANRFGDAFRHAVIALDGVTTCSGRFEPGLDVTFPAIETDKRDPLGNLRRIRGLLRSLRPVVLVTSNWGSIEWALANLAPLTRHIHTEDGFGPEERHVQLRRRVWTRRLALRRSIVVLPSRTLLRIATETWRLDPRRLRYIPNGVDLQRYASPSEHVRDHDLPVIGIVAALRPEKNVGRLLRAMSQVEIPARLVVVGDGGERAGLQRLATELDLAERVDFAGHVTDPQRFYRDFDLLALSSDTEQMPLSVLEAMAAGLPIAATDVGDVRTMLSEENRPFIVPPEDIPLAAALRALLNDPSLRRRVGQANRRKAAQAYDQEAMFQAYARLLTGAGSDAAIVAGR